MTHDSHIQGALECVAFGPEDFEEEILEAIEGAIGEESVRTTDEVETLSESDVRRQLILYRQEHPIPEVTELIRTVRQTDVAQSVVCVVDDGDWKAANSAVRDGAAGYLFVEQFDSPHLESHLRASVECGLAAERRTTLQRELEERSSELLGLNALANGVSSSLDRDVITRRGLWVFAGVCQQSAVALLELDPLPELQSVNETNGEPEQSPRLRCSASFSASGLGAPCGDVPCDESWRNVVLENHTAVLEGRPDGGEFPGLEPFWEDHPEGRVTILPLHANRRPYGALVMADVDGNAPHGNVSREGLKAMALQFASALENARLFAEIKEAYESLQETQDQLVHAEKFAAVGVLAAEIAHEINNPASFVISNLSVMVEYAETIAEYLDAVEELLADDEELIEALGDLKEDFEIGYLREDMEHLLSRSLSGMQRIHQVVQDLRYLSRDSGEEPGWVEIESLLDATVNLVRHEAKFRADIVRDYDGARKRPARGRAWDCRSLRTSSGASAGRSPSSPSAVRGRRFTSRSRSVRRSSPRTKTCGTADTMRCRLK